MKPTFYAKNIFVWTALSVFGGVACSESEFDRLGMGSDISIGDGGPGKATPAGDAGPTGNGATAVADGSSAGNADSGASAAALVFTQQPSGGVAGAAFATQPVVAVRDGVGNVVAADNTTQVTLALAAPGGGILSCSGGLTKQVVSGRAIFAGCTISAAGNYVLHAVSNPALTSADTVAFAVSAAGPAPAVPVVAVSSQLTCFVNSGPTIPVANFTAILASGVSAVNKMKFPAGDWASWFRPAPNLATIVSLDDGDLVCVSAPAGTVVGLSTRSAPPAPAAVPTQVVVAATTTNATCFTYSGPTTAASGLANLLSAPVAELNQLILPVGDWSKWTRSSPGSTNVVSIQSGDILCVSAPVGTSVFR